MKSLLFFTLCLLSAWTLSAQTFVGTTGESKNVVLEEFTGIHCGFCPDGHLRAANLQAANPNDVVLINIHAGSYANPSAGEPDFRTSFGTAIDGQASVAGYPAGTINRRPFPNTGPTANPSGTGQSDCATCTAMSRGYWTTIAGLVMAESSPANIANQSSIDLGTGLLTSVTELYYTANSTASTNMMSIVLMQNNVPGPQSGSTANPSQILPNGDYNHMHMLRHSLTGNFGTTISTTTTGSFHNDTTTYTVPASYTSVATSFVDMEVAVFVAESNQTIITGSEGVMTYIMPPTALDVSTSNAAYGSATDYCANGSAFTPSFTAVNETANTITSIEAQYTVNGGTAVPFTLSGLNLAQSASTAVTFPSTTLPVGANTIEYSIVTLNGSAPDVIPSNNLSLSGTVSALSSAPTATTLVEDFESPNLGSAAWEYSQALPGALIDNPDNLPENRFGVIRYNGTAGHVMSQCIRACYGSSAFPSNTSGSFIFDNMDMSNISASTLTFDYAHALINASSGDGYLTIYASTDCGSTWTSVWSRIGPTLSTAPANSAGFYYPAATSEWVTGTVDLTAYAGQSTLSIKFGFGKGTSANNLYVDNINIATVVAVDQVESVSTINLMPNPVQNSMSVEFSLEEAQDLNIAIFNALGQQVQHVASQNFVGMNTLTVNTSQLASGIYFLNMTSSDGTKTERFVVEK